MELSKYKQIVAWARELDGVFTKNDFEVAFAGLSPATRYREIHALIESGDLVKVSRGFYATPGVDLYRIASRIYPNSYISTGYVLAQSKVISSIPERKIQVVHASRLKSHLSALGTIEALSVTPDLHFGFYRKDNCNWATPEKAYLDACYFYYKRRRFSFNLESDVNRKLLNFKVIGDYLKKYDKRFVTFFNENFGAKK